MKTKFLTLITMILLGGLIFTSCDKNDDNDNQNLNVPGVVLNAFTKEYPNVKPNWSLNDNYYVAEFGNDDNEVDVWFTSDGVIMLTVKEIPSAQLPAAIKTAIQTTKYATWTTDDVKLIQRNGFDDLYKVEMDDPKSESDVTLYYTKDGVLVKEVPDIDNTPIVPAVVPQKITDALNETFGTGKYKIADFDKETNGYDADIILNADPTKSIEVIFNNSYIIVYYQWEITYNEVLPVVQNAFKQLGYSEAQIDDIYYRQTPEATPRENVTTYIFEVDASPKDMIVIINQDGTVLSNKPSI
ncbi:MAG: PepSY-like domain-containing protein [Bacteroidales bacterium]